MYHRILAALDVPPISRTVFDCASLLARAFHADLGLLYVFSPKDIEALPYLRLETLEEYPRKLHNHLRCYIGNLHPEHIRSADNPGFNLLQSYTRQAIAQGISAEFFVGVGTPNVAICDFAKVWQADLIVIGHRNRPDVAELLLGSVSNHVMHHAHCSVHVVRQLKHPLPEEAGRTETVASH